MDNLSRYWEMGLNSCLVDPNLDTLYAYDVRQAKAMVERAPWKDKGRYFKRVRISALALIKMVTHARSGGAFEVMGLMQGYLEDEAFVVTDAFRLPVEGTETRVNAHEAANEYMVQYLETGRNQGSRRENVVGWYHSHPGYGCWLSGIDVGTQQQQQMFNEPFVAVVIDPERTVNSAKVDIGAFRTLPTGYTDESAGPAAAAASGSGPVHRSVATAATGRGMSSGAGWQAVPFDKTADFGAHADRYYPLDVSIFRSSLDSNLLNSLWHKYWVQTLSQSPLTAGHAFSTRQIVDLASRVKDASLQIKRTSRMNPNPGPLAGRVSGSALDQVVQDAKGLATRERTGLLAGNVRERIFGTGPEEEGQAITPATEEATASAAAAPGSSAAHAVLIDDDSGEDDTREQQPTMATATDTTEPEVAPAGGAEGGPQ